MAKLILASASPRRLALLKQIGVDAQVKIADIDESLHHGESPEQGIQRLALAKAKKIAADFPQHWVLGADTFGVLDGQLLLKPTSKDDAFSMWSAMSGRWHDIYTAVAVIHGASECVSLNRSRVLFASISHEQMQAYWQTQEPIDKAGAYAIQGMAAMWVEEMQGSYSAIMGLPLYETSQILQQLNFPLDAMYQQ